MGAPPLRQHPNLLHRVEDLAVEDLIAKLRVEGLAEAVLPWAAGLDLQRLRPGVDQPLPQVASHELRFAALRNCLHGAERRFSIKDKSELLNCGPRTSVVPPEAL